MRIGTDGGYNTVVLFRDGKSYTSAWLEESPMLPASIFALPKVIKLSEGDSGSSPE